MHVGCERFSPGSCCQRFLLNRRNNSVLGDHTPRPTVRAYAPRDAYLGNRYSNPDLRRSIIPLSAECTVARMASVNLKQCNPTTAGAGGRVRGDRSSMYRCHV